MAVALPGEGLGSPPEGGDADVRQTGAGALWDAPRVDPRWALGRRRPSLRTGRNRWLYNVWSQRWLPSSWLVALKRSAGRPFGPPSNRQGRNDGLRNLRPPSPVRDRLPRAACYQGGSIAMDVACLSPAATAG